MEEAEMGIRKHFLPGKFTKYKDHLWFTKAYG